MSERVATLTLSCRLTSETLGISVLAPTKLIQCTLLPLKIHGAFMLLVMFDTTKLVLFTVSLKPCSHSYWLEKTLLRKYKSLHWASKRSCRPLNGAMTSLTFRDAWVKSVLRSKTGLTTVASFSGWN